MGKFLFFLTTWTGRLILINTLVFLAMVVVSGSWFVPDEKTLLYFGAKHTFSLIRGEYWRLFTPIFVHIGIIHFGFNNFALYYVGRYLEPLLGGSWFIAIYLISGLLGSTASAVFTFGDSAGASGAIFGIVGAGFVLERLYAGAFYRSTGQKLRRGPFTGLVVINVAIGLILTSGPVRIDNAAHLFGLGGGILMCLAKLNFEKNTFFPPKKIRGYMLCIVCGMLIFVFSLLGSSYQFTQAKYNWISSLSGLSNQFRYEVLTEAVESFPELIRYRLKRGILLVDSGQVSDAMSDFAEIAKDKKHYMELEQLALDYEKQGNAQVAKRIRRLLDVHK